MKKPTLNQLIEAAEREVNSADWYRQGLLLEVFRGLSKPTLNNYCKEMESIAEFKEGIIKPGHSTTFVNIHTFIWYLKWKDENKYRSKKIKPDEIRTKGA
ncbi:MAG: hypothetical protein RSC23_17060 [Carnobacterium sp.]|uniref:hypothetical protein n=1 Tax=Carnobacterium sp. TaxID=48221 RepID=UPI002FC71311